MTSITKSKKPIQTTDGGEVHVRTAHDTVMLAVEIGLHIAELRFDADSASRLAIGLRLAAIEVEGREETR